MSAPLISIPHFSNSNFYYSQSLKNEKRKI
jgi:hypothetical protein